MGAWISGTGDFVNVSGDGNGKGYDFATGGVTLGVDYRLTKNFAIGIAAGYAHTGTNLTGDGSIDVNSGKAGIYAAYYNGGFYLNGYVGGGFNSYDTQRDALVGNATGNTDGGEFNALVSGGYEFHCGRLTFGPIASLQYTYVDFGGFTESGSLAPLRIESKSQGSLRTNLGLSASYTFKISKVQITPSLRASWEHEYLYSALPIDAQFASGAGSVFTVNGSAVGHDSALIDAGLNVQ
jgi:outer membrane autotransporter protein